MTASMMDGKAMAAKIKADLSTRVTALRDRGAVPGLGTLLIGNDPASRLYVAGKHRDCAEVGIESIRIDLPVTAAQQDLLEAIGELNRNPACTSYLVQLPVPEHLDQNQALSQIDPDKDADGLHPVNLGRLVLGIPAPLPCTPRGIVTMLRHYQVNLDGAHVVVIGRGVTVGRPLSLLLTSRNENATVTLCHTGTRDLATHTKQADILVAAAGQANLVQPEMVKPGAVLVDVGITRLKGKPQGDIDKACWQTASLASPNPGGVGPMTRAMLLTNLVEAAERSLK